MEVNPSSPQPKTHLEARHQRHDRYSGVESAKAEDNGSRAQRTRQIFT